VSEPKPKPFVISKRDDPAMDLTSRAPNPFTSKVLSTEFEHVFDEALAINDEELEGPYLDGDPDLSGESGSGRGAQHGRPQVHRLNRGHGGSAGTTFGQCSRPNIRQARLSTRRRGKATIERMTPMFRQHFAAKWETRLGAR
jgi:hypothetical protein